MGWPASIFIAMHPVIGRDLHDMVIPPNPAPIPGPYIWVQFLPGLFTAVKMAPTVLASGFPIIQRGSDVGAGIIHVGNPASITLPFIILGSGSKSEFGSFSVTAENKGIATAFPFFTTGLNLDCQGPTLGPLGPFPAPTGGVIAWGTQVIGMSLGDIIASLEALIIDTVIQGVLNFAGSKLGGLFSRTYGGTVFVDVFVNDMRNANALSSGLGFLITSFMSGSPLGYSSSHIGYDNELTSHTATPIRTPTAAIGDTLDGTTDPDGTVHHGSLSDDAHWISPADPGESYSQEYVEAF